ncbi:MAG TPA: outer membrane beta-barrel protein [Bacteroidota bacterium]|nr:outer membrane beta-barrel protein [Bacteroidota bacterium]
MNKLYLLIIPAVLLLVLSLNASGQGQTYLGAGVDAMMPVGSFGDHWGVGFGATGELEYAVTPKTNITGKIGYLSWSANNVPSGVSATYSAVPLLAGIRYYPEFAKDLPVRFYGHLEMGLMIGSLSVSGTYASLGSGKTDFTISPSAGIEIPAGSGGNVDASIRYFDISEKSSIGLRVGYKFQIN